MSGLSLLAGPPVERGAEPYLDHVARLGALPRTGAGLIDELEVAGLRGRGGAGFPVATKWRAVAQRSRGRAVVLANGAEGEPLSQKDRLLMTVRPHLVIDGAVLAARTVGARRIILYVGEEHIAARRAMAYALGERVGDDGAGIELVSAPPAYVAGEESAAVHHVNDGVALPTARTTRPSEKGVAGRPTLVQNVESLAHVAVIARFGGRWFADLGIGDSTGTVLLTLCGDVRTPGVIEVPGGTPLGALLRDRANVGSSGSAVLLGGYFGGWVGGAEAAGLVVDASRLRAAGHSLGCGVVSVRGPAECGVEHTARIVGYLSEQSARQCGPCVFGLAAIAEGLGRMAVGQASPDELARLQVWSGQLIGRGACRHPDGAANLVRSALDVFADDFASHVRRRGCVSRRPVEVAA